MLKQHGAAQSPKLTHKLNKSPAIRPKRRKRSPTRSSTRSVCHIFSDEYRTHSSPSYNKVEVQNMMLRGSLAHTSNLLSQRHISSEQLIELTLEQIKDTNAVTNAYVSICDQNASLDLAIASDERRLSSSQLSRVDGIPISVKDNFHVNGQQTTAGSQFLKGMKSPYDATVVARLKAAGAIIIGKTNLDEFGMGSYGVNSSYGKTVSIFDTQQQHNPNFQYIPGGSSSGSAVSLQQYTAFASIGSDTGGSVRLPAAFTGTVGFKPTYGALSRYGLIAYGSSLDCPGIMTRTVADAKLIYDIIAGPDENDSTCIFDTRNVKTHFPELFPQTAESQKAPCGGVETEARETNTSLNISKLPLQGLKVGIPVELMFSDLSSEIKQVWSSAADLFTSLGAHVYSISLPSLVHSLPIYYNLAQSESVSNLARYDGLRYGNTHYTNDKSYDIGFYKKRSESEPILDQHDQKIVLGTQPGMSKSQMLAAVHEKSLPLTADITDPNTSPLQKLYSTNRELFFGPEVKQRLLVGNFVLSSSHYSSYIEKSMQLREELTLELLSAMYTTDLSPQERQAQRTSPKVDIILTPTSAVLPPTLAEQQETSATDSFAAYVDDVMTVFANLAGVPALSLPFSTATGKNGEKLPIAIQLIAAPCADNQLLEIGQVVQRSVKF